MSKEVEEALERVAEIDAKKPHTVWDLAAKGHHATTLAAKVRRLRDVNAQLMEAHNSLINAAHDAEAERMVAVAELDQAREMLVRIHVSQRSSGGCWCDESRVMVCPLGQEIATWPTK